MVARVPRVAVYGGDGSFDVRKLPDCEVRVYASAGRGGNGPLRRLLSSVRAGGVDRVLILPRCNGHSGTCRLVQECRRCGVPYGDLR